MKLSEAIRLGAMLRPLAKDRWFDEDGGSCSIGAALEAVGRHPFDRIPISKITGQNGFYGPQEIFELWPWTLNAVRCPESGYSFKVATIISSLTSNGWTRERVADWVATIEPNDAETAQSATEPMEIGQHEYQSLPPHPAHD